MPALTINDVKLLLLPGNVSRPVPVLVNVPLPAMLPAIERPLAVASSAVMLLAKTSGALMLSAPPPAFVLERSAVPDGSAKVRLPPALDTVYVKLPEASPMRSCPIVKLPSTLTVALADSAVVSWAMSPEACGKPAPPQLPTSSQFVVVPSPVHCKSRWNRAIFQAFHGRRLRAPVLARRLGGTYPSELRRESG